MALSRAGVFCTEPYRVPLAGKACQMGHVEKVIKRFGNPSQWSIECADR